MSVKLLEKKEDKILIEIDKKYTLKDIISVIELIRLDEEYSYKGMDKETIDVISNDVNKNWWEQNKQWFLSE